MPGSLVENNIKQLEQIKSEINQTNDKATLVALGLGKTHSSVEKDTNPAIDGMINKVKHVLKVENI